MLAFALIGLRIARAESILFEKRLSNGGRLQICQTDIAPTSSPTSAPGISGLEGRTETLEYRWFPAGQRDAVLLWTFHSQVLAGWGPDAYSKVLDATIIDNKIVLIKREHYVASLWIIDRAADSKSEPKSARSVTLVHESDAKGIRCESASIHEGNSLNDSEVEFVVKSLSGTATKRDSIRNLLLGAPRPSPG